MLKLRQMQEKKKAAAAETAAKDGSDSAEAGSGAPGGYALKRSNSKELLESRRKTSKERLFTLKSSTGKGGKKQNAAELRAQKDIAEMDDIPGAEIDFPDVNSVMFFTVDITPSDGLYRGATFRFEVTIPPKYPYEPPKAECKTLLYHPNIDWEGHVCLNILRADWMPVLNLGSVVFGLMYLFLEPNPDDPLNKEAAQLMIDRPEEFKRNVSKTLRGGYHFGRSFTKLL